MRQITIVFNDNVKTPFPNNRIHHNEVVNQFISNGVITVKIPLGENEFICHSYPLENIIVITDSQMSEKNEE